MNEIVRVVLLRPKEIRKGMGRSARDGSEVLFGGYSIEWLMICHDWCRNLV